jgi:hypothetical protein
MTNFLPVRVKLLRDRLERLDQLSASVAEAALLEDLRSDLAPSVAQLKMALDQCALLGASGIKIGEPASLEVARKRAAGLLDKFSSERTAASLKKGVGWANLVRDVKSASNELVSAVASRWKAYRYEIFTGEAPAVVRSRIAFTAANAAAFSRYQRHYSEFQIYFERVPLDLNTIREVLALAETLINTAKEFDYNVPSDVKRFLEAVQNGGASLELFTGTVRAWVSENDAFESYRIVPRGAADGRR